MCGRKAKRWEWLAVRSHLKVEINKEGLIRGLHNMEAMITTKRSVSMAELEGSGPRLGSDEAETFPINVTGKGRGG